MTVTETFFALEVGDMQRATSFYTDTLGAVISYATPDWTSLHVAGVRIGLFLQPGHVGGHTGLHFVVEDLAATLAAIERAGGRVVHAAREVAPGVVIAGAADTEGNGLTLRAR